MEKEDKDLIYSTAGEASAIVSNNGRIEVFLDEFKLGIEGSVVMSYETFQDKVKIYLGVLGAQFGFVEIKLKSIEQALSIVNFLSDLVRRNSR